MKVSATSESNLDGGPLNRLQVWQKESQHFSDEVMPKTFQPEDFYLLHVTYVLVGQNEMDYTIFFYIPHF